MLEVGTEWNYHAGDKLLLIPSRKQEVRRSRSVEPALMGHVIRFQIGTCNMPLYVQKLQAKFRARNIG